MPSFEEIKRGGYSRHRQASAGAAITLVCGCGEYVALFECAKRISSILGDRELEDLGDSILDVIPRYRISFADMAAALPKITEKFSVALVDMTADEQGPRFVLICRINPAPVVEVEREITMDDL